MNKLLKTILFKHSNHFRYVKGSSVKILDKDKSFKTRHIMMNGRLVLFKSITYTVLINGKIHSICVNQTLKR